MVVLFILSIVGIIVFAFLLGTEVNSKDITKRGIYLCLTIICYAVTLVGIAEGRYTKEIRCKSYEVKKIQEIKITDTDTISTSDYILYNIKRSTL